MKHWYRYEDRAYAASVDEDGDCRGPSRIEVHLRAYRVMRETPKGVWLDVWGVERFVRRDARKRFACPTVDEARESFVARKRRQLRILRSQVRRAEEAVRLVNHVDTIPFHELAFIDPAEYNQHI